MFYLGQETVLVHVTQECNSRPISHGAHARSGYVGNMGGVGDALWTHDAWAPWSVTALSS